jgi:transcriptional regulator with XRE-family HTH domain
MRMWTAMPEPIANLGAILRARRREKRLSLRDLADQTGVSFNTLSRVERGHIPDIKNFQRIVDWLELPAETFLDTGEQPSTPAVITRHLLADRRLTPDAAGRIAELVEDMYRQLAGQQPAIEMHLRAATTFTPGAATLLAEILGDMQSKITAGE